MYLNNTSPSILHGRQKSPLFPFLMEESTMGHKLPKHLHVWVVFLFTLCFGLFHSRQLFASFDDFEGIRPAADFNWCMELPVKDNEEGIDVLRFEVQSVPEDVAGAKYFGALITPYYQSKVGETRLNFVLRGNRIIPQSNSAQKIFQFYLLLAAGDSRDRIHLLKRLTVAPASFPVLGKGDCGLTLAELEFELWVQADDGIRQLTLTRQKWINAGDVTADSPAPYALLYGAGGLGDIEPDWRFEVSDTDFNGFERDMYFHVIPVAETENSTRFHFQSAKISPYIVNRITGEKMFFVRRGLKYRPVAGISPDKHFGEVEMLMFYICFFEKNLDQQVTGIKDVRVDAVTGSEAKFQHRGSKYIGNFRDLGYSVLVETATGIRKLGESRRSWIFSDIIEPHPPARFAMVYLPFGLSAETYEVVVPPVAGKPEQPGTEVAEEKTVLERVPDFQEEPILEKIAEKPAILPPVKPGVLEKPPVEEAVSEKIAEQSLWISGNITIVVNARLEGQLQRMNNVKGSVIYKNRMGLAQTVPLQYDKETVTYSANIASAPMEAPVLQLEAGKNFAPVRMEITSRSTTVEMKHRGPFLYLMVNPSDMLKRGPLRSNPSLNFGRFKDKFLDLVISLTMEKKYRDTFSKVFVYTVNSGLPPALLLEPGDMQINWLDEKTRNEMLKRIQLRNSFVSYEDAVQIVAESLNGYTMSDETPTRAVFVYVLGAPPEIIFDPEEELAQLENVLQRERISALITQFADSSSMERVSITGEFQQFKRLRLIEMNIEQEFNDLYFGSAMKGIKENLSEMVVEK